MSDDVDETQWIPWTHAAEITGDPQGWVRYVTDNRRVPTRSAGHGTTTYIRPADLRRLRAVRPLGSRKLTPLSETTYRPALTGPLAEAS